MLNFRRIPKSWRWMGPDDFLLQVLWCVSMLKIFSGTIIFFKLFTLIFSFENKECCNFWKFPTKKETASLGLRVGFVKMFGLFIPKCGERDSQFNDLHSYFSPMEWGWSQPTNSSEKLRRLVWKRFLDVFKVIFYFVSWSIAIFHHHLAEYVFTFSKHPTSKIPVLQGRTPKINHFSPWDHCSWRNWRTSRRTETPGFLETMSWWRFACRGS